MKLTPDQIKAGGRAVLSFGGGILIGRGTLTGEQLNHIIALWPNLVDGVGLLLPVFAGLWGAWKASPHQQLVSVAANPNVTIITAKDDVAMSVPSPKVVPESSVSK